MIGHSSKAPDGRDRGHLEWPMPDDQARLWLETADGVGPVTDAY